MVHGPADMAFMDWQDGPCYAFFRFFFCFLLFWPYIIGLYYDIFLFLYITKASPRLTLYRLKDKKGVRRLIALKTMPLYEGTMEGYRNYHM
jgi:hypothetical protein